MPDDEAKDFDHLGLWSYGWEAEHNATVWGAPESGMYPLAEMQDTNSNPNIRCSNGGAAMLGPLTRIPLSPDTPDTSGAPAARQSCAVPPSEEIQRVSIVMESHEASGNSGISRHPGEYYTEDEIFSLLTTLTDKEIERLKNFARFRLLGKTARPGHIEVDDLFIDAAIGTIERRRKWKRGVRPFNHFFGVMRSINHQRLKQAGRYISLSDLIADPRNWNLSGMDAQTDLAQLKERLQGDVIALSILEMMMDEMDPREAQQLLGISANVYWAARKRIRRAADNLPGAPCIKGPRTPKRSSPKASVRRAAD